MTPRSLVHTVAPGDRLSAIAGRYRVPVASILAANPARPRVRTSRGTEVFASLAAGDELVVPTLGWPWSDCPEGYTKNWATAGCTPPSVAIVHGEAFAEQTHVTVYALHPGACTASDGPNAESPSASISGDHCVCLPACWTGDTCDCESSGLCKSGACGSLETRVGGMTTPPDDPFAIPKGAAAEAACAASGGTWDGATCIAPAAPATPDTTAIAAACAASGGSWDGATCVPAKQPDPTTPPGGDATPPADTSAPPAEESRTAIYAGIAIAGITLGALGMHFAMMPPKPYRGRART